MNKEWKCFPGSNCPKCGSDPEVFTRSKKDNYVYDEEDVRCCECGHTGMISVEDSECADVIWDDLKESSNKCKRKHQKCILTDCNCQPKDINVPQLESNNHVHDTNVVNINPHAPYINGDLNPLWFSCENEKDGLTDNVPQWVKVKPDGSNLPDHKDYSVMYELGYIQDGEITASLNCRVHPADFTTLHKNKSFSYFRALPPLENVRQVLKSTVEMHNELIGRITQLEKQTTEYREALEKIIATHSKVTSFGSSSAYREAYQIAEQALNPKDNG